MHKKICVLGDGAWGTAFASLLANNGHQVNLWCYNSEIAKSINSQNINHIYFPNKKLDSKIKAFTDLKTALVDTEIIFEAIPVKFFREILIKAKPFYKNQIWVVLSKGLELRTFLFPTQIIEDVFEKQINKCVISGPSFAQELFEKKFTAVDIALMDKQYFVELASVLQNDYFKLNYVDDLIGIQVAGAFKNVVTLAIGIAKGLNYGDNAIAYIFTKGLEQIEFLVALSGGKKETIYGLSGVGDIILSSFGQYSKNLKLGIEIGQGKKIEIIDKNLLPEGINTLKAAYELVKKKNVQGQFIEKLYKYVFEGSSFEEMFTIPLRSANERAWC